MHQAAWERNFFGASRRAFLGDGQAANWTIQQRHFPSFQAILDFVHALSYIFAAALAGRPRAEGAAVYARWIQAAWSGQVEAILPELETHSAALGAPPLECTDSDPRKLVFEALRYLRNNADRMRYDDYRRMGLPIMTSAVESMIKQINRRVKGSEKFWSEPGAEAILQLRADYLSETEPMADSGNSEKTTPVDSDPPPSGMTNQPLGLLFRNSQQFPDSHFARKNKGIQKTLFANSCTVYLLPDWSPTREITGDFEYATLLTLLNTSGNCWGIPEFRAVRAWIRPDTIL